MNNNIIANINRFIRVMPQKLKRLSSNIMYLPHYSGTDRPVLAAISGKNSTLIVDAGNSPAHVNLFLSELSKYCLPPIEYVAITHWHWDHVFGITAMNYPTYAHIETKKKVEELSLLDWSDKAPDERVKNGYEIAFCRDMIKAELPYRKNLKITPPDMIFTEKVEINLGEIACVLENVGGDHSIDSSVIYVPSDKVLFLGDCIYEDIYGEYSYSYDKVIALVKKLLSYDADIYVEAHSRPITKKSMQRRLEELLIIAVLVQKYKDSLDKIKTELRDKYNIKINAYTKQILNSFMVGLRRI